MRAYLIAVLFLVTASPTWAASQSDAISQTILSEYSRLRKVVSELKPEFQVGGYLNGKMYGDHKLLWRISDKKGDNEVIRIYREKGGRGEAFAVEYFFSNVIVEGRQVIRRFVGPADKGWRNDTVDFVTERYLGRQGSASPQLDARDVEILKAWDISLFEN